MAVHCSAGIGRTGTFIAVDIMRLQLQRLHEASLKEGAEVPASAVHAALAVPDLVHLLRQQRMGWVRVGEPGSEMLGA